MLRCGVVCETNIALFTLVFLTQVHRVYYLRAQQQDEPIFYLIKYYNSDFLDVLKLCSVGNCQGCFVFLY